MTPTLRRELGAKRAQCRYRIREALENNGESVSTVARDLNVSAAAVSRVLCGVSHSKRILDRLRAGNVPEEYLFDPHCDAANSLVTTKA